MEGIPFSEWELLLSEETREKLHRAYEDGRKGRAALVEYEYLLSQGKYCFIKHWIIPILSLDGIPIATLEELKTQRE